MHGFSRFGLSILVVGLLIAMAAVPSPAHGQTTATLAGVVEDATGGRLPAVAVSLTEGATNVIRTAQTDAAGRFVIAGLPAGEYNLRATLAGFAAYTRSGLRLTVAEQSAVAITMRPAGTEQVSVQAETPSLNL